MAEKKTFFPEMQIEKYFMAYIINKNKNKEIKIQIICAEILMVM